MPVLIPISKIAFWTAAAPSKVICAMFSVIMFGLSIIDIHMPLYLGDTQFRPSLPRPEVCSSLITTVPCSCPLSASSLALELVEPMVS